MGIDPGLFEKLVCPKCRGPLKKFGEDEALDCEHCGLRYPVSRYGDTYVPDMIIEHAQKIGSKDEGS